jgi:hypothetical protein
MKRMVFCAAGNTSSSSDMQWKDAGLPAALLDPFNPLKSA